LTRSSWLALPGLGDEQLQGIVKIQVELGVRMDLSSRSIIFLT
jgi:hypothetical protein